VLAARLDNSGSEKMRNALVEKDPQISIYEITG
jgi:hypothetical protein